MRARYTEVHRRDLRGVLELVGYADGIADQVAPYAAGKTVSQVRHMNRPAM